MADDELLAGIGSETSILGAQELREAVKLTLDKLGPRERVLIVPPVHAAFVHLATHSAGRKRNGRHRTLFLSWPRAWAAATMPTRRHWHAVRPLALRGRAVPLGLVALCGLV